MYKCLMLGTHVYLSVYVVFALYLFLVILFFLFSSSDDSGDECPALPPASRQGGGCRNSEIQSTLRTLNSKVEDLTTCNDLIVKHGSALQR